ncbi:hypothetical protein TKK_0018349 [Trichogramma kaykai]
MTTKALNKLCPAWAKTDPDYYPVSSPNPFLDSHFTFLEMNVALEGKNEASAPGKDGIGFDAINELSIKTKLILLDILNEMYTTGSFPQKALRNDHEILAAFLDVEGAFDNVDIDILTQKLAHLGCSHNVIRFIKYITHERHIFSNNNLDKHRILSKGVPQGAVLSPLLYALYATSILQDIPENVGISQFADDLAVFITTDSHANNLEILEVNLNLGRKMQQSSTPNARLDHYINSGQFTAIYTDASKSKDSPSVGYAYYCEDTQFEDKTSVSNLTSVYTAECAAINAALDYILQFNQKRFLVISDSHSALTSLNTVNLNIKTNPYIYEIKRKFLIYVQQHPNNALEFLWVPGHEGLSDKRKQLFQKLLELKVYPPYNTEQFLAFPNSAPTIAICQFISISKLQI